MVVGTKWMKIYVYTQMKDSVVAIGLYLPQYFEGGKKKVDGGVYQEGNWILFLLSDSVQAHAIF